MIVAGVVSGTEIFPKSPGENMHMRVLEAHVVPRFVSSELLGFCRFFVRWETLISRNPISVSCVIFRAVFTSIRSKFNGNVLFLILI